MSAIENIAGGNIAEAVFKLFTISATGKAAYFRPSPSLAMLLKRVAHNVPAVIPFSQPPVALTRVAFLSHRSYYLIGDFENFEISPLLSFFRDATFVLNENSFNSQVCRKDRSRINCRKILDFDLSENKKTIVNEKLYVKFFFLAWNCWEKNNETRSFIFIRRLESFSIRRQVSRFTISSFVYETSRKFNYEFPLTRTNIFFKEENSRCI